MKPQDAARQIQEAKAYFDRSTRNLTEADSGFTPAEGIWTVAQQVAHTAQTVDWFVEGVFRPEGFEINFEKMAAEVAAVSSLAEARAWLDRAFEQAAQAFGSRSPAELAEPLPPGPIMGGEPRAAAIGAIVDHTAHHRGALTVYSRLLGRVPAMPYMEM